MKFYGGDLVIQSRKIGNGMISSVSKINIWLCKYDFLTVPAFTYSALYNHNRIPTEPSLCCPFLKTLPY